VSSRLKWLPQLGLGNATLDAQHRALLDQCEALAGCVAEVNDARFDEVLRGLMTLAREHFDAEEALLGRAGYPEMEALRNEREEFEYLAAEIITTENFDRQELETFLSLWWSGHILGSVGKQRTFLERLPAA